MVNKETMIDSTGPEPVSLCIGIGMNPQGCISTGKGVLAQHQLGKKDPKNLQQGIRGLKLSNSLSFRTPKNLNRVQGLKLFRYLFFMEMC